MSPAPSTWSSDRVRDKFSEPDRYLQNSFQIVGRAAILRMMLPSLQGLTILDVGCGDGSLSLQFLAEAKHVTLVDLSIQMLLRAERKIPSEFSSKVTLLNAELTQLQVTEPADVVICVGVLAHVGFLEPAIRKLAALTKIGGKCVVQITDVDRIFGRIQCAWSNRNGGKPRGAGYSLLRVGGAELQSVAESVGFRFCQRKNHCLLLPGMGYFPPDWLLAYDAFVLRSSLLSRWAPSAVIMFERSA
jgi:SAM-dependent methyltransferase